MSLSNKLTCSGKACFHCPCFHGGEIQVKFLVSIVHDPFVYLIQVCTPVNFGPLQWHQQGHMVCSLNRTGLTKEWQLSIARQHVCSLYRGRRPGSWEQAVGY